MPSVAVHVGGIDAHAGLVAPVFAGGMPETSDTSSNVPLCLLMNRKFGHESLAMAMSASRRC